MHSQFCRCQAQQFRVAPAVIEMSVSIDDSFNRQMKSLGGIPDDFRLSPGVDDQAFAGFLTADKITIRLDGADMQSLDDHRSVSTFFPEEARIFFGLDELNTQLSWANDLYWPPRWASRSLGVIKPVPDSMI